MAKSVKTTSNRNWVKAYIVDVLPCISIAFYVLAFIYHTSFYSVFGIEIIQYTTFGDIFLSITEPLIVYALITAIIAAFTIDLYDNRIYVLLEEQKKRKTKRIRYPKIYYPYTRFMVKRRQDLEQFFGFNNKTKKISIIYFLILSLTFFTACIAIYEKLIENKDLEPSLNTLSVALILPLFILFFFCAFLVNRNPKRELIIIKNIKKRPVRVVIFVACYYFYAFVCFSGTGSAYAKQLIENNPIVFETLTSDGTKFTDKDYGYIGHMSNETFLYDKKAKVCVILRNEGIVYTKIKNHKRESRVAKNITLREALSDFWKKIKKSI